MHEYLEEFLVTLILNLQQMEVNLMRKFQRYFIAQDLLVLKDVESSIAGRNFRDLNFDFSKNLKDVGKILIYKNIYKHK